MNASPDMSGLVSVLWNAPNMLACEEYDMKQKTAPPVQTFMHSAGIHQRDHESANRRTSNPAPGG